MKVYLVTEKRSNTWKNVLPNADQGIINSTAK